MNASSVWKTGCAVCILCAATSIALPAQTSTTTFKTLANFGTGDGEYPNGFLGPATDGNFYSTTSGGGTNRRGVIFKMTPEGAVTTLYDFCSENDCSDGWAPSSAPTQGTDGNFYGTTDSGGSYWEYGGHGGSIFKITPAAAFTTLYSFCEQAHCADGSNPDPRLIEGFDGDFYGTTVDGGAKGYCPFDRCGTVFQITAQGTLTTLYSFCAQANCADGANPEAGVVQAADGNLYGTTNSGGSGSFCPTLGTCGTVFKLTPQGNLTTLYSFCAKSGCTDGSIPEQLIQGEDGNFYGETETSGNGGPATIFKITPQGALTTLYTFCALLDCADGEGPDGLIQASDGNFYGTTYTGGTGSPCAYSNYACGTIFKMTSTGTLTTLYNFCPEGGDECLGGSAPGGLVQGTDGSFYGKTAEGGASNACYGYFCGTAFNFSIGLPAFVETQTTAGSVGTSVVILGTNLTGTTSVTFNGTSAAFSVVSGTEITATVPSGATTGPVYVTTPSGTLKSNRTFHIAK